MFFCKKSKSFSKKIKKTIVFHDFQAKLILEEIKKTTVNAAVNY